MRVIDHVESIDKPHQVWTLNLGGEKRAWSGLAATWMQNLIIIAVSTGTVVQTFVVNDALTAGTPLQRFDDACSHSRGLCFHPTLNSLLVVNGPSVLELNLHDRAVTVWAHGFKTASDVAVDTQGNVAVADRRGCKVSLFTGSGELTRVWGSGIPGNADGKYTSAQFNEPVGIAFLGTTAVVATYGGDKGGHVSLVSSTDFGVRYMRAIDDAYLAVGYMPRHQPVRLRKDRVLPVGVALEKLKSSAAFFTALVASRKAEVGRTPQGPEGSPSASTVKSATDTITGVRDDASHLTT